MKPLTRRSVTTGLAAAVTVIPVAVALPAQHGQSTTDLIRAFIRKLLTERNDITAGEWIERKKIVRGIQAMIGDEVEPWGPYDLPVLAEMLRDRQGPAWEWRS